MNFEVIEYALKFQTFEGEDTLNTGTVKWFNTRKGYGFIQPSDGGKDVFVHITKLEEIGIRHLNDGQKIQYELYNDRGRIAAGNLVLL